MTGRERKKAQGNWGQEPTHLPSAPGGAKAKERRGLSTGPVPGPEARDEGGAPPFSADFLKQFEMIRLLGRGAMGAVYLMRQVKLDRLVAVKVVRDEAFTPDICRRFQKEARILASISHDGIIAVYEAGMDGAVPYMVSEYVQGQTLGEWLNEGQARSVPQILRLVMRVLDGLKTAHQKGIIHRDLKPGNIFLTEQGRPKIGDFGLAKEQMNPSGTSVGKLMGTPQYMSPEQCRGSAITEASDIYAIGLILFEMLAGYRPFPGPELIDYLNQHTREPAPRLAVVRPDLPEALDGIVARALEKDPGRRFKSAGVFRKALLEVYRNLTPAREATPSGGAAVSDEPPPDMGPGRVIANRYELVRTLGQGGMGQVWLARDSARHGAEVAIKLLPPELWRDAEARGNLVHEANLALRLAHPNIVRLINLEPGDPPVLVMEYIPGPTLAQVLSDRKVAHQGPLPLSEALALVEDLAGAVDFAHTEQVIHRDIKPSNVILQPIAGGGRRAKLADFGIAAEVKSFRTRVTGVVPAGTLAYMSPEQVACQRLDGRSDLYALAATLYQMLMLEPPFNGEELAFAIQNSPVPEPRGVPPAVQQVLYRGLAKKRDERFKSAKELAQALRAAVEGGGQASGPGLGPAIGPAQIPGQAVPPGVHARVADGGAIAPGARPGGAAAAWPAASFITGSVLTLALVVIVASSGDRWSLMFAPRPRTPAGSESATAEPGGSPGAASTGSPPAARTSHGTPAASGPPAVRPALATGTGSRPSGEALNAAGSGALAGSGETPAGHDATGASRMPSSGLGAQAIQGPATPSTRAFAPEQPSAVPIGPVVEPSRSPVDIRPEGRSGSTVPGGQPGQGVRGASGAAGANAVMETHGAMESSRGADAGEAVLEIVSVPAGAELLVDGKVRGHTPLSVQVSPDREVRLLAQKPEYVDEVRYVNVRHGSRTKVELSLSERPVDVSIESVPPGASVSDASGRGLGQTPCSASLAPGSLARLRFELKGFKPTEMTQVVTRGMRALVGRLEPEGPGLSGEQQGQRDELVATGERQMKDGDVKGALDSYGKALTIDSTNGEIWRRMAIGQYKLGMTVEAMASIRQAYAVGSGNPAILNTYANMLLLAGDARQARDVAGRAAQLSPRDVHVLDTLGQCCEKLDDRGGALDAYRQALAADPAFTRASEAIHRLTR